MDALAWLHSHIFASCRLWLGSATWSICANGHGCSTWFTTIDILVLFFVSVVIFFFLILFTRVSFNLISFIFTIVFCFAVFEILFRSKKASRQRPIIVCFDETCDWCAMVADIRVRWLGQGAFAMCLSSLATDDEREVDLETVDCWSIGKWLGVHGRSKQCHKCVPAIQRRLNADSHRPLWHELLHANNLLLSNIAAIALLGLSLAINLTSLGRMALPYAAQVAVAALHVDQHWAMFAPHPVMFLYLLF